MENIPDNTLTGSEIKSNHFFLLKLTCSQVRLSNKTRLRSESKSVLKQKLEKKMALSEINFRMSTSFRECPWCGAKLDINDGVATTEKLILLECSECGGAYADKK